jgi:hypothetical protein
MLGMDFARLRALVESTYGLALGSGRVFFVGSSTDRWFVEEMVNNKLDGSVRTTLNSAVASCEADRGDVIVVLPGTHTLTAALAPKSRTRIVGIPGMREATFVSAKAATVFGDFTANGVLIQGLTLKIITGVRGLGISGAGCVIQDCAFRAVSGTPTSFLSVDGTADQAGSGLRVLNSFFSFAATSAILFSTDANDQVEDVIIDGCIIGGDTNGVKFPSDNWEDVVVSNNIINGATNPFALTAAKTGNGSIVCNNAISAATGGKADVCGGTAWPASVLYVNNTTVAGLSTAAPA